MRASRRRPSRPRSRACWRASVSPSSSPSSPPAVGVGWQAREGKKAGSTDGVCRERPLIQGIPWPQWQPTAQHAHAPSLSHPQPNRHPAPTLAQQRHLLVLLGPAVLGIGPGVVVHLRRLGGAEGLGLQAGILGQWQWQWGLVGP